MIEPKPLHISCPECGSKSTFWKLDIEKWKCVECEHEFTEDQIKGQCVNCLYAVEPAQPDETATELNGVECCNIEYLQTLGPRTKAVLEHSPTMILYRFELIMTGHDGSVVQCPGWSKSIDGVKKYLDRGMRPVRFLKAGPGWMDKMKTAGFKYDYVHLASDNVTYHAFYQKLPSSNELNKLRQALRAIGKTLTRGELQELR